MSRGPVLVALAAIAGVLLGERAGADAATAAMWFGLAVVLLAGVTQGRTAFVLLLVSVAMLGSAQMQRALHGATVHPFVDAISRRADATISGTLIDDPSGSRFVTRARVAVTHPHRTVWLVARGDAASRVQVLDAGDRVVAGGWWSPLQGRDQRLRWQHAIGTFNATDLFAFHGPRMPPTRAANRLRAVVLRGNAVLPPQARALVSGLLLGDTRALPYRTVTQFRDAGLSHLLAVSGENLAFVLAALGPALRRVGYRGRFVLGCAVVIVFGTMTRWEPSILRAAVMTFIVMLGVVLGRPTVGLRVLAMAITVLLLADPFLVHSVGFQLSCAASAGIIVLTPRLESRLKGPRWFREALGATAAAQLGVAPILFAVFGSVPLVALPANLVAVPIAAVLTTWGFAAGIVGGVSPPVITRLLAIPTTVLSSALLAVARLATRLPLPVSPRSAIASGALIGLVGARRLYRERRCPPTALATGSTT